MGAKAASTYNHWVTCLQPLSDAKTKAKSGFWHLALLIPALAFGISGCQWQRSAEAAIGEMRWRETLPALPVPAQDTGVLHQDPKAFGIYQWDKQRSYGEGLKEEIAHLGTPPSYTLYFVDKSMGYPKDIVRFNADRNIRTIVTQELMEYSQGWNADMLDSINGGRWDAYFRKFARAARSAGTVVYYRFGYEMNGDWVGWGEKPEAFRLAWRRAWRIFQEEKARNVKWVFSPNVIWGDRTFEADILPYYPGAAYVDVVGLDGYNFGDGHSRHHSWKGYETVFGVSLRGMKEHFKGKPVWITEIGCANGEGKTAWIGDFLASFNKDPDLRVFIWFNEDKQYAGEPNWRLDSEPESLETFRDWAIRNNSITTFALPAEQELPHWEARSEGI